MKKILSLLIALTLVLSLVACGEKKVPEDTKGETVEDVAEKTIEGEVAKIGLGTEVVLKSNTKDDDTTTQSDTIFAVVAFDSEGKILKANIDNAQSKFVVDKDGKFKVQPNEAEFKTKHELGDEYNMKPASKIKKEWFEQMKEFEKYIVGKTVEEVTSIKTEKRDDNHPHVPAEPDLLSSVTIDIGEYQMAVAKAWENAQDVTDVNKLSYKAITSLGHATQEAKDGKGATVQFETAIAVVGLKEDDTVSAVLLDNAQNSIELNLDGSPVTDLSKPGTTKKELGDAYNMKPASKIGKEWDEQIEGLEKWLVGKNKSEISDMKLGQGKPTDADLVSSTTININTYKEAILEALD